MLSKFHHVSVVKVGGGKGHGRPRGATLPAPAPHGPPDQLPELLRSPLVRPAHTAPVWRAGIAPPPPPPARPLLRLHGGAVASSSGLLGVGVCAPVLTRLRKLVRVHVCERAQNEELFAGDDASRGSCRHIELDTSRATLKYEAGDHLAVYPWNSPAYVAHAATT
jgi:hypothetical protein